MGLKMESIANRCNAGTHRHAAGLDQDFYYFNGSSGEVEKRTQVLIRIITKVKPGLISPY